MRSPSKPIRSVQAEPSSIEIRAVAGLLLLMAGVLLGTHAAFAYDETESEAAEAEAEASTKFDGRPSGIAHIELPLGFRARFDATATRNFYHSEDLAEAFIRGGPQFRYRRALESRISLSRVLAQNVQFEIAWGARSPIENVDLLNFQRQTVGALLRIVH